MALKRPQLIIPAVLLVIAVLAYFLFFRGKAIDPDTLRLSGHIEATETDLGFKVPRRADESRVQWFITFGEAF